MFSFLRLFAACRKVVRTSTLISGHVFIRNVNGAVANNKQTKFGIICDSFQSHVNNTASTMIELLCRFTILATISLQ